MTLYFRCRLKRLELEQDVYRRYLLPSRSKMIWQKSIDFRGKNQEKWDEKFIPFSREIIEKDFPLLFSGHSNHLEICCGTGSFLLQVAQNNPENNFIGVDIALPCLQRAMKKAAEMDLRNIFFYCGGGEDFLRWDYSLLDLDLIMINFPDPWPKKCHHKRRVVQDSLLTAAAKVLRSGKKLVTATDIFALALDHVTKIEQSKDWRGEKNQPLTEYPLDYYQFASVYQEKNLSGGEKVFYTDHIRG